MLASRTMLLYLYCICTFMIDSLPRLSTMWFTSLALKLNFSPLDAVSTKPQITITFPKSSSLPIPFMQLKESLTCLHTPFKSIQWSYLLSFENSFFDTRTTLLNSGNVSVISTSLSTKWSTKKLRPLILFCSSPAKLHRTSARRVKATTS